MKRIFCAVLALCMNLLCINFVCATEEYPNPSDMPDESYRTMVWANELNDSSEIDEWSQNSDKTLSNGVVYYTPHSTENMLYFQTNNNLNADNAKIIEIRIKIPVTINDFTVYFPDSSGSFNEACTLHYGQVQASEEYQRLIIDTSANNEWYGTKGSYRIRINGGVESTFEIDYIRFWGKYPNPSDIPDESYRTMVWANELNDSSEIDEWSQNSDKTLSNGVVYYTPHSTENMLYFQTNNNLNADNAKIIEIRIKIPVTINDFTVYFPDSSGSFNEACTLHYGQVQASEEYQRLIIDTSANNEWYGTKGSYRIRINGGVESTFEIDYVRFWGDYNLTYTEDEKKIVYDFNTPDYGFNVNEFISNPVPYNSELWIESAGDGAALTTNEEFEVEALEIKRICVSYNNQTQGTKGKLYFKTSLDTDYNDECSFEFDILQGQGTYEIHTGDNQQWKDRITGLRLAPSDKEGVLRIGYISLDKFNYITTLSEGIIGVKGNLYGETGRVNIKAINTETKNTDYEGSFEADTNGDFDFSFRLDNESFVKPVEYDLFFTSDKFEGTFKKSMFYVNENYSNELFEKINSASISGDVNLFKKLIVDNYEILQLKAEHYEAWIAENENNDEFYKELIKKNAADWGELEKNLNETAILMKTKYMSADEWLKAIDDYDTYLQLKELPAYKIYETASETVKEKIMSKMSAEHCSDLSAVRYAFQKNTVLTALSRAVAWGDVKNILQTNAKLLNIDFKEVNGLKSPSEVYRQLTEKEFMTFSEVKSAFDKAVEQQKKKEASSSGSTGGSGSGGGGSTGGKGIYVPIINTADNKQPTATQPPISTATPAPEIEVFNDLSGFDWAKQDILELYDSGIISGTGNGYFEPSREVKREEFVKMIVSAFDLPLSAGGIFDDVQEGAWYAEYIGAAVNAGFTYGQGDIFGVGQPQSRQDVAVMVARALNLDNAEKEIDFTDCEEISDYAKSAVGALVDKKILTGYDDGTFRPLKALTRAEAAVIINRVRGRSAK